MKGFLKVGGLAAALIILFAVFSFLLPNSFPTASNLEKMLRQVVIVGLVSVGMTYVIASGGIDLSVGSMVALVSVATALAVKMGVPPLAAIFIGVLVGAICGLINGLLVAWLKVGSFIVTLAGLLAFRGAAKGLGNERTVNPPDTWLSGLMSAVPANSKWMLFPPGVWILLAVVGIAAFIMNATVFGRNTVAVGSNAETSRLSGISPAKITILVFTLCGALAGLAGVMLFSRLTIGDPTVAQGLELSVVAAVVIGGASLQGGEASCVGSLLGALIMVTIDSGSSQLGWSNWVQEIVTGGIIVGAVALDRWRISRSESKLKPA